MPFAALLERLGLRRPVALAAPEPIMAAHGVGQMPRGPAPGSKLTEDFVTRSAASPIFGHGRW